MGASDKSLRTSCVYFRNSVLFLFDRRMDLFMQMLYNRFKRDLVTSSLSVSLRRVSVVWAASLRPRTVSAKQPSICIPQNEFYIHIYTFCSDTSIQTVILFLCLIGVPSTDESVIDPFAGM